MVSARRYTAFLVLCVLGSPTVFAQHEHTPATSPKAPRVFLDKSPRVVAYQLKRLSNEQLRLIETKTDDVKYAPVFLAILTRDGMSLAYREEALRGLISVNSSDAVSELSGALRGLDATDANTGRTVRALAQLLLNQPAEVLLGAKSSLVEMTESGDSVLVPVAYAALLASGDSDLGWDLAEKHGQQQQLLSAISLIPSDEIRAAQHARVLNVLGSTEAALQAAAIGALAHVPASQQQTFLRVADLVEEEALQDASIRTLLSVPLGERDSATSLRLIKWLVEHAEKTPPEGRTEDEFLDAMELVEQLLAKTPAEQARGFRRRLRETVVRVVRIHTVEEEMRYDIPYFAVEAGRPVQIVLVNEDLMPHNLVITQPGALKQVADEGLVAGTNNGLDGKQYVPNSDQVLHATHMIPTLESERLTFDAPSEPGEYPYVCTFPRHWMRMYGVMVVVEDLDAWLANPTEPTDPIGSNRQFVQNWSVDDFREDITTGLRGRTRQIGERLFVEATCAQCHQAGAVGQGKVGPELSGTFAKLKGDPLAVLQEILDPSHRIDDKYAVHLVLDVYDKTTTGVVVSEDKDKIAILENPEAQEPTVILKDDIEQQVKTSNSMMPKGLMDRFSRDEIFELLSFIQSVQK